MCTLYVRTTVVRLRSFSVYILYGFLYTEGANSWGRFCCAACNSVNRTCSMSTLFRWNCWIWRLKKNICLCWVVMSLFRGRQLSGWRCQFTRPTIKTCFQVSLQYLLTTNCSPNCLTVELIFCRVANFPYSFILNFRVSVLGSLEEYTQWSVVYIVLTMLIYNVSMLIFYSIATLINVIRSFGFVLKFAYFGGGEGERKLKWTRLFLFKVNVKL